MRPATGTDTQLLCDRRYLMEILAVEDRTRRRFVMELGGVVMLQAAVRATVGARATVGDITTIDYCICYWGILAAAVSS